MRTAQKGSEKLPLQEKLFVGDKAHVVSVLLSVHTEYNVVESVEKSLAINLEEQMHFCLSSEIQPVLLGIKPEQEKAIWQFLLGRDVFVALLTGYGKSLCYFVLSLVFDRVRDVSNRSI